MSVDREVTQAQMSKLAAATLQHTPSQKYTVGDRFEQHAGNYPDREFLYYRDRVLSYGTLNAEANRVAHAAIEAGLQTGDVVALLMENRPEFITTWVGLAKLGITTALLNTQVRGDALRHELEVANTRHIIVGSECLENLATVPEFSSRWHVYAMQDRDSPATTLPENVRDFETVLVRMPETNPDPCFRDTLVAGDDLFHMFTSGTTGLPKAARLSHMRYLGVGDGMGAILGYTSDDVIACVLPLFHGAGGMVVISCALSHGSKIYLRRKFSASQFWDDARRYGITSFQYIGEICRYLLNQPARENDRDHSVRLMTGAGLGADIWSPFQERFGIDRIYEGWSSTEANTNLLNIDGVPGSCGRIPFKEMHNGRLIRYDVETDTHPRNADGFCIECEADEVGEFVGIIPNLPDSGAGRFEGYTSKEATERKIMRGVFQPGDAWYRSGDLLIHDADDYYFFVDRIGDTFRWKSENVSTQEAAEALGGFPGLEIANVYGVKVPNTEGRAGMAALVMRDPSRFDGAAFFAFVSERLPHYAQPVFLRLVAAPDMTSTFKLRKVDLQREGYDLNLVKDPIFMRQEDEKAYVALTPEAVPK